MFARARPIHTEYKRSLPFVVTTAFVKSVGSAPAAPCLANTRRPATLNPARTRQSSAGSDQKVT